MKNSLKLSFLAAAMFAASQTFAQEHKTVDKRIGHAAKDVGHATGSAARNVGHATGSAAKDVGHATGSAARNVGHATGSAAKDVGHATGSAARNVGHATGSAARDVGHKTSEVASKGAAAVSDNRYEGHWSRTGDNVYIDEHHKYFYVDKKGHRQFITQAQMRTKRIED
ncbi:hypothetical protein [Mucilaginibacter panaciglaebae]